MLQCSRIATSYDWLHVTPERSVAEYPLLRGLLPKDHVLAYRVWDRLYNWHSTYMACYTARAGKEPKGRSPYASLDEARSLLGTHFHLKNVHFR